MEGPLGLTVIFMGQSRRGRGPVASQLVVLNRHPVQESSSSPRGRVKALAIPLIPLRDK